MTAKQTYDLFKKRFPNSTEGFVDSQENVDRWRWHIQNAAPKKDRKKYFVAGMKSAESLANHRRFYRFENMPGDTQMKYFEIASIYAGRRVWATGSRVSGEYIDQDSPNQIRLMREALGKAEKKSSDYDFVVDWLETDTAESAFELKMELPSWADLLPHGVPDSDKIEIPMWDFTKLPKAQYNRAIKAYNENRRRELMAIHNEFDLSPAYYCCDSRPAVRWFKYAIENGIITEQEE